MVVNVLVGVGQAIFRAVALSERCSLVTRPFKNRRKGLVGAEPLTKWRRPVGATKNQSFAVARPAGVRTMARKNRHVEQIGEPLWSSPDRAIGHRPTRTKQISRWEDRRVSDEVIVSIDPMGQHNPLASQGPLGRVAFATGSAGHAPFGPQELDGQAFDVYKVLHRGCMQVLCLIPGPALKVTLESLLEAVLGKTRRTEF